MTRCFQIDAFTDDQDANSGAPLEIVTGSSFSYPQPTIVSIVPDPGAVTSWPYNYWVGSGGASLIYQVTFDYSGTMFQPEILSYAAGDKYLQFNRTQSSMLYGGSPGGDEYVYDFPLESSEPVNIQVGIYSSGAEVSPLSAPYAVTPHISSGIAAVIPNALSLTATPDGTNPTTEVDLSWTGWNTLTATSDVSRTEIFEVSDGTVSNVATVWGTDPDTGTPIGEDGSYTASAGPAGTEFFVVAYRNLGGSEAQDWDTDDSNFVNGAGTGASPVTPDAPTSLTATLTDESDAILHWQDNSDDETGFLIETRPLADSSTADWTTVDTVSADATSMVLTGALLANFYENTPIAGSISPVPLSPAAYNVRVAAANGATTSTPLNANTMVINPSVTAKGQFLQVLPNQGVIYVQTGASYTSTKPITPSPPTTGAITLSYFSLWAPNSRWIQVVTANNYDIKPLRLDNWEWHITPAGITTVRMSWTPKPYNGMFFTHYYGIPAVDTLASQNPYYDTTGPNIITPWQSTIADLPAKWSTLERVYYDDYLVSNGQLLFVVHWEFWGQGYWNPGPNPQAPQYHAVTGNLPTGNEFSSGFIPGA